MKKSMVILFAMVLVSSSNVFALTIIKSPINDPTPLNVITGFSQNLTLSEATIWGEYGECFFNPTNSHYSTFGATLSGGDGFGYWGYFDLEITKDSGENGVWDLNFYITNKGPYIWTSYHIEFQNPDFRMWHHPATPYVLSSSSDIFGQSNWDFDRLTLDFWDGELWPTQTVEVVLTLDFDQLVGWPNPEVFYMREVAVTQGEMPVPEPSTILLVATGLIGLVGFRKKFKK